MTSVLDFSPTHFRVWNSMRLGWLKSCPYKLFLVGIEGWQSKREAFTLRFGREYQYALEIYDRLAISGHSHDDATRAVVRAAMERTWVRVNPDDPGKPWGPQPEDGEPNRNRETLVRSIVWYLEHFKNDPAKTITLDSGKAAVELTFQLDAGFGYKGESYIFSGHLDRVVEFGGEKYVDDNKHTTKTVNGTYFTQYDMNNQMSLYSFASKIAFNTPVRGIMITAAQVAVGFTRFERGYTFRSDERIEEWLDDTRYWIGQAQKFSEQNKWPQNDQSCFLCEFKKVCAKSPSVRNITLESDFVRRPHDPLEIR